MRKCIDSLLAQTYRCVEIIIIDDGSTDNTRAVCEKLKSEEKDIKIQLVFQDNQGVSAARNAGLDWAQGKFIFFADADDELEKDAVENCIKLMDEHDLDLLVFGYYFDIPNSLGTEVESIPNTYQNIVFSGKEDLKAKLVDLYDASQMYNVWNKVFRKELIDSNNIKFPVGKAYNEDRDFVREYLPVSARIEVIPDCYYHYYRNDSSITGVYRSNLLEIRKEEYLLLKNFFASYGLNDKKTIEFISRQHVDRIMGCVDNLFYISNFEGSEKRKFIKQEIGRIINDDITRDAVKNAIPRSKKMKIMIIPYRKSSVNGVYLSALMIHAIKMKYPQLFHKLKQAR